MGSLNKVILIGNLGKDPEVRALKSGVKVADFSLATSITYKDSDDEKQTKTEWHNIVVWRGLADVAEKFLVKGMQVSVEGHLETQSWEDDDGTKHYKTQVVAENLVMLGKPSGEAKQPAPAAAKNNGKGSFQKKK